MIAVRLVDGPAEGYFEPVFDAAPETLRAVVDLEGEPAILDLPDDEPALGEQVFTYRRGGPSFMCGRGRGGSGCRVTYHYSLWTEAPRAVA